MKIEPTLEPEIVTACETLGLPTASIALHRKRALQFIQEDEKPSFKIVETCRLNNFRLFPHHVFKKLATTLPQEKLQEFVAVTPAAGACSRYSKPLITFLTSFHDPSSHEHAQATEQLLKLLPTLPQKAQAFLNRYSQYGEFSEEASEYFYSLLNKPKAFFPCVTEGLNFLSMKCLENINLQSFVGQVFIVPPGQTKNFEEEVLKSFSSSLKTLFLEQGPSMSTLRFHEDGSVALDNKLPSLVPGGHGELAKTFSSIAKAFPTSHSLFIRNIDNVIGTKKEVLETTETFLQTHLILLEHVKKIRTLLAEGNLSGAEGLAQEILASLPATRTLSAAESSFLTNLRTPHLHTLWKLQFLLFQTPLAQETGSSLEISQIQAVYNRPVNTLGQVFNTAKDYGGVPVVVETAWGQVAICLEIPHFNAEDVESYLLRPEMTTHFNPVFVACEIPSEENYYTNQDHPFWIISRKPWKNQEVYYHETLLYELLGNSYYANTIFLDIPRYLFNPHKVLQDVMGRKLGDWQ